MWNIHRESRNTWNTDDSLVWFRYKTFIYLFKFKVFRYEERETQFLSMLTFPSNPTMCNPHRKQLVWPRRAPKIDFLPLDSNLNLLTVFFQIPKSSALPGMTSFTSPVTFPIWGFYCDISDFHICPVRTREHLHSMCAPN